MEKLLYVVQLSIVGFALWKQFYAYKQANGLLKIYKNALPPQEQISLSMMPIDEVKQSAATGFLPKKTVPILYWQDAEHSAAYGRLVKKINAHLIKNNGIATDFSVTKNLTQSTLNALEEQFFLESKSLWWLGLVGTGFAWLVLMFSFGSMTGSLLVGKNASHLLYGLGMGLLPLVFGNLAYMYSRYSHYKPIKMLVEQRKIDFFHCVQINLLPTFNQTLNESLHGLERHLLTFNATFFANVNQLNQVSDTNFETLKAQENVLRSIQQIDVMQLASFNVNVLKELKDSVHEFQLFNTHLGKINTFIDHSTQLTLAIDGVLKRTENMEHNIKTVAENVHNRLEETHALMRFLTSHFENIDLIKHQINQSGLQFNNALIDVDRILQTSLNELREHTQSKIMAVRDVTIAQETMLEQAFEKNRGALGSLNFLEQINTNIAQLNAKNTHKDLLEAIKQLEQTIVQKNQNDAKLSSSSKKDWAARDVLQVAVNIGLLIVLALVVLKNI